MSAVEYLEAGWALCKIPRGRKGPDRLRWQVEANAIRDPDTISNWEGNVGLLHAWSRTAALDVDNYTSAKEWLFNRGVDLDALLAADDAVQVRSGRENRAKLLYRLPAGMALPTTRRIEEAGLELRCASSAGLSMQDVLPPSIHPDTRKPYTWGGAGNWRDLPELPPAIQELWAAPAELRTTMEKPAIGGRNNMLTSLGGTMRRRGMSERSIEAALQVENQERFSPPLDGGEVAKVARSLGKYQPDEAPEPAGSFVWGDTLTAPGALKPSKWAMRKLLPANCTALLFGAWGTFKTFLVIDWVCCIANGIPWHGITTAGGTAFYLAGEGEDGFARRLRAWEIANGHSCRNLAFREMPDLRNAADFQRLREEIAALATQRGRPAIIVIDTLFTALAGGEENSGKDMGEVFAVMRSLRSEFNCVVLAVHHTGYEGTRSRGHSSMPSGVDCQFFIQSKEGSNCIELANPKQKDGSKHPVIFLESKAVPIPELVDDEGEIESSLVICAPHADMVVAMVQANTGPTLLELKAQARKLQTEGLTVRDIAAHVGRDFSTVSRWLKG